jgi:hypothetical protein
MEAVLRWTDSVTGVFDISRDRFFRVCMILVMSGVLCLCIKKYMHNSSTMEVDAKGAPAGMAGIYREGALADLCRHERKFTENMMEERLKRRESLCIYETPAPVCLEEPERTAEMKTMGAEEMMTVGQTDIAEAPESFPYPGTDISKDLPSAGEVPPIPGDRPAALPSLDLPAVTEPVEEERPVDNDHTGTIEIAGYVVDEEGYIIGYTSGLMAVDGILLLATDESCIGIRKDALNGLACDVTEVFIPANITDIEPGAFDALPYLIYIEVAAENPVYYSKDGILHTILGEAVVSLTEG